VIEKEPEDEGYSAHSPSLPGCFSNGRTVEETKRNMREAVTQHVASLIEHGDIDQGQRRLAWRTRSTRTEASRTR
jgi:predicted RNase H-like HicB family nuclease